MKREVIVLAVVFVLLVGVVSAYWISFKGITGNAVKSKPICGNGIPEKRECGGCCQSEIPSCLRCREKLCLEDCDEEGPICGDKTCDIRETIGCANSQKDCVNYCRKDCNKKSPVCGDGKCDSGKGEWGTGVSCNSRGLAGQCLGTFCEKDCGTPVVNPTINRVYCMSKQGSLLLCALGSSCSDGVCKQCISVCSQNQRRCSGNGYQSCIRGSSGCFEWDTNITACPSGQSCSGQGFCVSNIAPFGVIFPSANEQLGEGQLYTIKWNQGPYPNNTKIGITILIVDIAKSPGMNTIDNIPLGKVDNTGSYNWVVNSKGWVSRYKYSVFLTVYSNNVYTGVSSKGELFNIVKKEIPEKRKCSDVAKLGNPDKIFYQRCVLFDPVSGDCLKYSNLFSCMYDLICANGNCVPKLGSCDKSSDCPWTPYYSYCHPSTKYCVKGGSGAIGTPCTANDQCASLNCAGPYRNLGSFDSREPGYCSNVAVCGDKKQENPEECDDGNLNNGDGCSNKCSIEIANSQGKYGCGNGIKERNERCDDGNLNNGDGCSDACGLEGTIYEFPSGWK